MNPPPATENFPIVRRLSWTRTPKIAKRYQLRRYFTTEDYKLNFKEYEFLQNRYGPFTCDGACDDQGLNTNHAVWFSPSNSFMRQKFCANDNVYCNPPFSEILHFLDHYFSSKHPATRACFILPRWPNQQWYKKYVGHGLRRVHTYRMGADIFTVPKPIPGKPAHRVSPGPLRWDVDVYVNDQLAGIPPVARISSITAPQQDCLLTINGTLQSKPANFLIDSGAGRNFLAEEFLATMDLTNDAKLKLYDINTRVRQADGQLSLSSKSISATFEVDGFRDQGTFVITTLPHTDAILGKPWLSKHNPDIDWNKHTITMSNGTTVQADTMAQRDSELHLLSAEQMNRLLRKKNQLDTIYICCVKATNPDNNEVSTTNDKESTDPLQQAHDDIQQLTSDQDAAWTSSLRHILHHFVDIIKPPTSLPPTRQWDHSIELVPDAKPPKQRCYRMSPAETADLKKQLNQMLDNGWIRPSTSPFGAPVLMVKKKDGTNRACIDYRQLNSLTKKNVYPIPRIDEMLDNLQGAKIFTSMDLYKGYHQCRLNSTDGSIERSAFKTRWGLFEYLVLPFGLCNAPATFMAMMNDVLRPYLDKFVLCFLDDILIYSKSRAEHLHHLQMVLSTLLQYHLHLQLKKCSFGKDSVLFLGHIVSQAGISVDPAKIEAVQKWPTPTNLKEIRAFLGFANYYRRFVRNYSKIAGPIQALTKTTSSSCGQWNDTAQKAFEELKQALTTAPTLVLPQIGSEEKFTLYTDASGFAIGAVLLQDQGNGLQPVSYHARRLHQREANYPIHEKELLAVVDAIKTFRCYLEGCARITVITDHDTLRHFMKQKDLSGRRARWSEYLSPYISYLEILYRKGSCNQADALSRRPDLEKQMLPYMDSQPTTEVALSSIMTKSSTNLVDQIKQAYQHDNYYLPTSTRPSWITYSTTDNLFYVNNRVCVPQDKLLRQQIMFELHDSPMAGHPGVNRTLANITRRFYWPGMSKDIRYYVKVCTTCQRVKSGRHKPYGTLHPLPVPDRPWQIVGLDLVTDLPPCQNYDSMVVFVCLLTKQAFVTPTTKTVDAAGMAAIFRNTIFRHRGLPDTLVSDMDTRFISTVWQNLFQSLGTTLIISTAYHPMTDGQTERTIQSLEGILRGIINPLQDNWVELLPLVEFCYNNRVQDSIATTPFVANLGFDPVMPADIGTSRPRVDADPFNRLQEIRTLIHHNVALAKLKQQEYANKGRLPHSFQVGDKVRVNAEHLRIAGQTCQKLRDRFVLGPFEIIEQISPVSFRLRLPAHMKRVHLVFHVDRLELLHEDEATHPSPPRPETCVADETEFQVDSIINVRFNRNSSGLQFLVNWAPPYDAPDFDSWEPFRTVDDLQALDEFLQTATWRQFVLTPRYLAFAAKYPSRIPSLQEN